jgi:hypothetical protein
VLLCGTTYQATSQLTNQSSFVLTGRNPLPTVTTNPQIEERVEDLLPKCKVRPVTRKYLAGEKNPQGYRAAQERLAQLVDHVGEEAAMRAIERANMTREASTTDGAYYAQALIAALEVEADRQPGVSGRFRAAQAEAAAAAAVAAGGASGWEQQLRSPQQLDAESRSMGDSVVAGSAAAGIVQMLSRRLSPGAAQHVQQRGAAQKDIGRLLLSAEGQLAEATCWCLLVPLLLALRGRIGQRPLFNIYRTMSAQGSQFMLGYAVRMDHLPTLANLTDWMQINRSALLRLFSEHASLHAMLPVLDCPAGLKLAYISEAPAGHLLQGAHGAVAGLEPHRPDAGRLRVAQGGQGAALQPPAGLRR